MNLMCLRNALRRWTAATLALGGLLIGWPAQAQYDASVWWSDVKATRWETGLTAAGLTAQGLTSWNWGSSSFKTSSEGWFGLDTGSGGTDKLGHALSSYAMTNVLAAQLVRDGRSPERAALSAALTTQAMMTYVELFDGFSGDHGFSVQDMVMNLLGSGLAYARTVNPKLRDTLDFRMEYRSSGYKGFRPLSDYPGQKFLLAFKLSGLEGMEASPLRFVELHAGYYARGFTQPERDVGLTRKRFGFVGLGLNLQHALFGARVSDEPKASHFGRLFLEHVQLPGTAFRSEWDIHRR